jgi:hypothetical protein
VSAAIAAALTPVQQGHLLQARQMQALSPPPGSPSSSPA